jgi:hypothetical protein
MRSICLLLVASCVLGAASLLGCADRGRDPDYQKELRAFAAAYHQHVARMKTAPTDIKDLKPFWATFPHVRDDIQSGQFVVAWGVELEPTAAENDKYVLGYEVDVPESGGLVVLGGGSIRQVSPEEFATLGRFKLQGADTQ